jgi:hypothetical protein
MMSASRSCAAAHHNKNQLSFIYGKELNSRIKKEQPTPEMLLYCFSHAFSIP